MKKKILTIFMVIGMVVGVVGCGEKNQAEKKAENLNTETAEKSEVSDDLVTLRYAVSTGNASHWLGVIGQKEGFFEKNGVSVEIQGYAAGINTADAVTTEQADIGYLSDYAFVNRIGNTKDSTNLRLISRFDSEKNLDLYVNPDEVSSLEDLAGKPFITMPGTARDYWTQAALDAANIKEEDRVLVNVENQQAALAVVNNKEGVAFWTGGSGGRKMEEAGMKALINISDIGLQNDSYFFTTDTLLSEKSEAIQGFLKGIKETEEWINENPDEAAEIIEEELNIPKEQYLEDQKMVTWVLDLKKENLDYLNEVKAWIVNKGSFDDYDINDFVDDTALKSAFPDAVN